MTSTKKMLVFLMFVAVSSQSSQRKNNNENIVTHKLSYSEDTHCSNDSTCPTWFICNSEKKCQCGKGHTGAIVCNNKSLTSAVLVCHCLTYDGESGSTFVGSCFYNCENYDSEKIDLVYHQLPKKPETLINTSICSFSVSYTHLTLPTNREV